MPLMNMFEPLFLLLVVLAVVTVIVAGGLAVAGRRARAGRILRRLAIGAAVYFAVVIAVSIVSPRRVYQIGDAQCFDDWCIAVAGVERTPAGGNETYAIAIRLSNRARRVPMGERDTVVYLTDGAGHRYDPLPDAAAVAFDTVLQPGESVLATRRFLVPRTADDLGLVYTHEGGFPIGWLIIGEGGWLQKPPVVKLQ
jgi:hypothetical protein